ncbi:MAG: type II toxin-antitoxin system HicB family antitoxin [Caldilineaceae bacterium]|nr:type II toxin-antitoxin system HicB family antitoxin [Caldilineaceae bacterium]
MKEIKAPVKWTLSCSAWKEGDWYVSRCEELEVASQGRSVGEAIDNLQEALQMLLETYSVEDLAKRIARFYPELHADGLEKTKDS